MRFGRSIMVMMTALCAVGQPAAAGEFTVIQKNREFSQSELRVRAGDDVVFTNLDIVMHNVYSASPGNEFQIRKQMPGQTHTVRFVGSGRVDVQCAVHPSMSLVIHVAP